MARTNVPLNTLKADGSVTAVAATAVDPANGHVVPSMGLTDQVWLRINNTAVSDKVATIKVVPADANHIGGADLALTVTASTNALLGPFTSDQFEFSDGLHVDLAAGITGTIEASVFPKSA